MYRRYLPWYLDEIKVTIKEPSCAVYDKSDLTLLNWNVHKNNHHYKWLGDFKDILKVYDIDLISFQEYEKINHKSIIDKDDKFGYGFLPNISFKESQYGLLMAFKSRFLYQCSLFSKDVEPWVKTHKVSFLCRYELKDNSFLTVINVHMINFVKIKKFKEQLNQIREIASLESGRLIICGDFNTWSKKRMNLLLKLISDLDLSLVKFSKNSHKKILLSNPLDHIFYRGLEVVESKILDDIKTSDHKPMLVRFKLI
jgi:endonuclease/exonuclease/phosphatase (EEP) superfamily protein YafD